MKKNSSLLLLIITLMSFTNYEDPAPKDNKKQAPPACPAPSSSITSGLVNTRLGIYADKKKTSKQMYLRDQISYSPAGFEKLLMNISAPTANYDGFRVYFACFPEVKPQQPQPVDSGWNYVPANEFGQLTLIFVPTRADASKGKHYHGDDIFNCWIINGGTVQPVPSGIASLWIKKAVKTYLFKFETTRQTTSHNFKETHALWYSNSLIVPNNGDEGILHYLDCRIQNKTIDAVNVKLGGFGVFNVADFKSYHYKLTLIFNFHSNNLIGNNFESLFIADFTDKFKKRHALTDDDTDTGKPCPLPDCNTLGSLLPQ